MKAPPYDEKLDFYLLYKPNLHQLSCYIYLPKRTNGNLESPIFSLEIHGQDANGDDVLSEHNSKFYSKKSFYTLRSNRTLVYTARETLKKFIQVGICSKKSTFEILDLSYFDNLRTKTQSSYHSQNVEQTQTPKHEDRW